MAKHVARGRLSTNDKVFNPGDDVSELDSETLKSLVEQGIVEKQDGDTTESGNVQMSDTKPAEQRTSQTQEEKDSGSGGETQTAAKTTSAPAAKTTQSSDQGKK